MQLKIDTCDPRCVLCVAKQALHSWAAPGRFVQVVECAHVNRNVWVVCLPISKSVVCHMFIEQNEFVRIALTLRNFDEWLVTDDQELGARVDDIQDLCRQRSKILKSLLGRIARECRPIGTTEVILETDNYLVTVIMYLTDGD